MKKRLAAIGAVGSLVVAAILALGELRARADFAAGQQAATAAGKDLSAKVKAIQLYRQAALRISTVSGKALAEADLLQKEIDDQIAFNKVEVDEANKEKLLRAEEARKRREAEEREAMVTKRLAAVTDAKTRQDWPEATRLALAVLDELGGQDPRAREVKVPVKVVTKPAGAKVSADGGSEGKSPCVVEVPARQKSRIRVSKPGFTRVELVTEATGWLEPETVALARGYSWRCELQATVLGSLAAGTDRVFSVTRDGRIFAIAAEDGAKLWEKTGGPAGQPDAFGSPTPPCVAQGTVVVGGRTGLLIGFDPATGNEVWRIAKAEAPIAHAAVPVTIEGQPRAVVARGQSLAVLDAATGAIEREIPLPGAPSVEPVAKAGKAVVVLVDGRVAAFDLARGRQLWCTDVKADPVGPPILAPELGIVLVPGRTHVQALFLANEGKLAFKCAADLGGPLDGGVSLEEGKIVAASGKRIGLYEASDGRKIWEQNIPQPLAAAARRFGGSIFAPLRTGELLELSPSDGRKQNSIATDALPSGAPIVGGTKLFLASGSAVFVFERVDD